MTRARRSKSPSLKYTPDCATQLFAALRDRGPWPGPLWSAWLDSGAPISERAGRFDILVAGPVATLLVNAIGASTYEIAIDRFVDSEFYSAGDDQRDIWTPESIDLAHDPGHPFHHLRMLMDDQFDGFDKPRSDLPFHYGAIGYLSYEFPNAAILTARDNDEQSKAWLPVASWGLYARSIVVDHVARSVHALGDWGSDDLDALIEKENEHENRYEGDMSIESAVSTSLGHAAYKTSFNTLKRYINDGDCYQANLTRQFSVQTSIEGDAIDLYHQLRQRNAAPMSAFMDFGEFKVLSTSPERFIELRGDHVSTKPIKGTRKRSLDVREDAAVAQELLASEKDRAENVMIVDLLRNDLGRVCEPGSVQVPSLLALESYATVHHLVSTVEGRLRNGLDAIDLLHAVFPGGSITGAPKKRAMEIIEELEPHRREIYCGAIGYIAANGDMDMNIPIRTMMLKDDELRWYAGGAVVADSQADDEFYETELKAHAVASVLQDLGGGGAALLRQQTVQAKRALRKQMMTRRDALDAPWREQASQQITERLVAHPSIAEAKVVLVTASFGSEIATDSLVDRLIEAGKIVALPKVEQRQQADGSVEMRLALYRVKDLKSDVTPGHYGIREPKPDRCELIDPNRIEVIVTPGLAFTADGKRLGYGGGYFDRLFEEAPNAIRIAAGFGMQVIDDVPCEPHDAKLHGLVTESHAYEF